MPDAMSIPRSEPPVRSVKYRSSFELVPRGGHSTSIAASNYSLGMTSISSEPRRQDSIILPPLDHRGDRRYGTRADRRSRKMRKRSRRSVAVPTSYSPTLENESSPPSGGDPEVASRSTIPKSDRDEDVVNDSGPDRRSSEASVSTSATVDIPADSDATSEHIQNDEEGSQQRPDSRRTSKSSPKRHRAKWKDAPASIEKIQRILLVTSTQVSQDVKTFRLAYLHRTSDVSAAKCKILAEEILDSLEIDHSKIKTPQDFQLLLNDRRLDTCGLKKRSEFEQIEGLCQRAVQYDVLMQSARERLKESKQLYLDTYLVSFAEEDTTNDIQCVRSYEENIQIYRSKIQNGFQKLRWVNADCKSKQTPFVTSFLPNAPMWTQLMNSSCGILLDICDVIRRWCHEDRMYPKKLWEEIINGNGHKGKLREEIKRLKRKEAELSHHISRKESSRGRLQHKIGESKREERRALASLETVAEKEEKLTGELLGHKLELRRNENLIKMRKSNSPVLFDVLWKKSERVKEEIARVEGNLDVIERHKVRLQTLKAEIGEAAEKLEEEVRVLDGLIAAAKIRLEDIGKHAEQASKEMVDRATRIAAAKHIRELKLSPVTVRRIHIQRSDVIKDPLTQACGLVARYIGKDWKDLYLTLPFFPPRDPEKRKHDVEVMDTVSMRRDQTMDQLALHSLQKWRIFHRRGSIPQLARCLRKLRKPKLAMNVELAIVKAATA